MNTAGAIAGMLSGLAFTAYYIAYFKAIAPELNSAEHWWFGISPEGIGMVGAIINFAVAFAVSRTTATVPEHVIDLVEHIRIPKGVERPHEH